VSGAQIARTFGPVRPPKGLGPPTTVGVAALVASGLSPVAVMGSIVLLASLDGTAAASPLGPWTRLAIGLVGSAVGVWLAELATRMAWAPSVRLLALGLRCVAIGHLGWWLVRAWTIWFWYVRGSSPQSGTPLPTWP
jgi:hypothetical protein